MLRYLKFMKFCCCSFIMNYTFNINVPLRCVSLGGKSGYKSLAKSETSHIFEALKSTELEEMGMCDLMNKF